MKAHTAHDPVENKGGPCHVASRFQQGYEEEEEEDLRKEDDHTSNAAEDTVNDKVP
jgi:hypothetical protein